MTTEQYEVIQTLVRSFRIVVDHIDSSSGSPEQQDGHSQLNKLADRAERLLSTDVLSVG